jgi:hypothetical protein
MPDFHIYRISPAADDDIGDGGDPQRARARSMARIGQIRPALELEMHAFTGVAKVADPEDLLDPGFGLAEDQEVFQPAGVGDIIVDPQTGDAWLCATFGWESLSWDRSERFIVDATHRSHPDGIPKDDAATEPA